MSWFVIRHDLSADWWPHGLLQHQANIENFLETVVAPIDDKSGLLLNISVEEFDLSIYLTRMMGPDYVRYYSKAELDV